MDPSKMGKLCSNNICTKEGLKCCTRCKVTLYCSKECQVQHWMRHKKCCKMISSSPEMRLRYGKTIEDYEAASKQIESGDYDQALLTLQNSLEIFKEFKNDVGISSCYYSIGHVLSKSQYEEALVNYRKALEIFREIYGENHAETCNCYEAIGNTMSEQGRYDDALIGYGKALAIRMKIFGDDHIDAAYSYFNIGVVLNKKCKYDEAIPFFLKAKAIYTRELGAEHPKTVDVIGHINTIGFRYISNWDSLILSGKVEEATASLETAQSIISSCELGEDLSKVGPWQVIHSLLQSLNALKLM